jgi:hypothetical protein
MLYNRGFRDGRAMRAPCPEIWGRTRKIRDMTAVETADYMAGWNNGNRSLSARDMERLGYGRD